jgi:hypothetical protein
MESISTDYLTRLAPPSLHHCGSVLACEDAQIIVGGDWGSLSTRRAASCQLLPAPGDWVLISGTLPEQVYVIAVLERRSAAPLCTQWGDDVTLRVDGPGRATFSAADALTLKGGDVSIIGRTGRLLLSEVKACARSAVLSVRSTTFMGDVLESSLGRLSQFLGSSQRTVKGLDQTRSGDIDCRAEQTLALHGQHVFATANKLVRVDGDQVHIG